MFSIYRRLIHQSDELNCDLTETNTTHLDQYNPRHFLQNTITDVYQLYYKNDGSLYCDNLHDAGNKNLVMFLKSNTKNNGGNEILSISPDYNDTLGDNRTTIDKVDDIHSDVDSGTTRLLYL